MTKYTRKILISLIVLLALFLRIYGLNWDQYQHLHPDERFLTMVATDIKIPNSFYEYINPNISTANPYNTNFPFYVYGTFPLYLTKIVAEISGFNQYNQIHLVGRTLSILFDLGIVFILYNLALRLFNPKTALLTTLIYSLMVLPIQLSHFFAVDTFLNFFIILSFYLLVIFQKTRNPILISSLLGLVFALAAASKISAVYFSPILFFGFINRFNFNLKTKKLPKQKIFELSLTSIIFTTVFLLVFRIAQPHTFTSGNFLDWHINPQYILNIKTLQSFNDPNSLFPPGIQWRQTIPFIFPLKNLILWGLGLPLGIVSLVGIIYTIFVLFKEKFKNIFLLLILVWVLGYFVFQSFQFVKTMRYFLPIYPFIAIIAAYFLFKLDTFKNKLFYSKITFYLILIILLIYPFSFISIYTKDITRITASGWIYQNIKPGSIIANEHWDDPLPLYLPSNNPSLYLGELLPLFNPDTAEKWQKITKQLETSDYIVLSSNRLYASIPQNQDIYPQTSLYYQKLLNGSLGFQKIAQFTSYPCFPPTKNPWFCLNDDSAEEAFTVYDHPKVMIFQKTPNFKTSLLSF